MADFMFQNMAYRATVYRTGGGTFLDADKKPFIFSITYNFQINKEKKMLHTTSFPFD